MASPTEAPNFLQKNIRTIELVAVVIPIAIWLGTLNISSFQTLTTHTEQIKVLQTDVKEEKDTQKELQNKLDEKFDKIQNDLTEIKLILKDKVDKKN